MINRSSWSILVVLALATAAGARAQAVTDSVFIERESRERWIAEGREARFTPWSEGRMVVRLDSVRRQEDGRRLHLNLSWGQPVFLEVVGDGGVRSIEAGARTRGRPPGSPDDSVQQLRFEMGVPRQFEMPETRVRDIVPVFRPGGPPRAGRSWTDTIAIVSERGGYFQALRGTRISTILRDTLVGGRPLWIVRDSARVSMEDVWRAPDYSWPGDVLVRRETAGTVTGVHVYDSHTGLFTRRSDTTYLSGWQEMRVAAAPPMRHAVRYEGTRAWRVMDPAAHAARREELIAESRRERGGMVQILSEEQQRLRDDPATVDSVAAAWSAASDPDERARLRHLLRWAPSERRAHLIDLAFRTGDTTAALEWLLEELRDSRRPLDEVRVRQLLPFLEEPSRLARHDVPHYRPYTALADVMVRTPPAVTPDSARWPLTPEAWRLLEARHGRASQPRLRELALIALALREPRAWYDSVVAPAAEGSTMLTQALHLLSGTVAPTVGRARPIPGAGAGWREWLAWEGGRVGPRGGSRTVLRMFDARSDRDVVAELRTGYEHAAHDSARLVFGAILMDLGELQLTGQEVRAHLAAGTPARRALALLQVQRSEAEARPAAPAVAASALDTILHMMFVPRAAAGSDARFLRPILHAPHGEPFFLASDRLPPALHAAWDGRARLITMAEWSKRDARRPGVLIVPDPVTEWEGMVFVGVSWSERTARAPDEAPAAYAGRVRVMLRGTADGWEVTVLTAWVT